MTQYFKWIIGIRTLNALMVMLLMSAMVPASHTLVAAQPVSTFIQPQLLQITTHEPETHVRVIVQQASEDAQLDKEILALGGYVTRQLDLINGFAATLPAGKLLHLADAEGLRYISLDAPTIKTGLVEQAINDSGLSPSIYLPLLSNQYSNTPITNQVSAAAIDYVADVRDEFSLPYFGNNDGSANWSGSWLENDTETDGAGPSKGQVQIVYNSAVTATSCATNVLTSNNWTTPNLASDNINSTYAQVTFDHGPSQGGSNELILDLGQLASGGSEISIMAHSPDKGNPTDNILNVSSSNSSSGPFENQFTFAFSETDINELLTYIAPASGARYIRIEADQIGGGNPQSKITGIDSVCTIGGGQLRLDDTPDTGGEPSAARTVDLSGATSASLTFNYETTPGVDRDDAVAIEVSNNGGASYTVLETFTDIIGASSGTRSYDISSFMATETTVRFRVASLYGASNEYFKVDNVQINYTDQASDPQSETPEPSVPSNPVFTTWATEFGLVSPVSNPIATDFEKQSILNGSTIWFNSVVKADPPEDMPVMLHFDNGNIRFTANSYDFSLDVPASTVIYDPDATVASTIFDDVQERWITTVPLEVYGDESFLTGLAWPLTFDLVTEVSDVTWTGRFTSNLPDEKFEWKWAAAVYSTFDDNHSNLAIKPVKGDKATPYDNKDEAGTPQYHKPYLVAGGTGKGDDNYVGDYSSKKEAIFTPFTKPIAMVDSALGPDGTYGYAGKGAEAFAGFEAVITPGFVIDKVEVALHGYATTSIDKDLKFTTYVDGVEQNEIKIKAEELFADHAGQQNSSTVYLDITETHDWRWSDFDNNLELMIEHHDFKSNENHVIYYDAIGLRVTGTPGTEPTTSTVKEAPLPYQAIDASNILNAFPFAVRAPEVWNQAPSYLQGQRMTIAVIDSGIGKSEDLKDRNIKDVNFNQGYHDSKDMYGHGTFVATMMAGDAKKSKGAYIGIAPKSKLLNVRVSDDQGMAYESDVVAALEWILENKDEYDTRVVNLSLNSSIPMSYHDSPMSAAVEILWFNGIVVVVAAGNNGTAELYPPANDPYVITVGATDDLGTWDIADDYVPTFSAYGTTSDGHSKPDLVAPGKDIVMYLPSNNKLGIGKKHKSHQIDKDYFRMSGTSMAAPIVAAAAALVLQDEPHLTPDQVKHRLMSTANKNWTGYDPVRAGAGYLDIYAAVNSSTVQSANQDNMPHLLLAKMAMIALWANQNDGDYTNWDSVNWNSVNWNSVNWNSVNWNSVNWNSVSWGSANWNSDYWDNGIDAADLRPEINDATEQQENSTTQNLDEFTDRIYLPTVLR